MVTKAPVDILRFIDQIDCSVWAATHSEDVIIDSISACFTSKSAIVWYKALENSKRPHKLTINDIRRGLLKDFGVENWETVMARYDPSPGAERHGGDRYYPGRRERCGYYQTQEFKLRLSYLDEIEGLKDQIKFRNRRALEDGKRMSEMKRTWESIVSKKNKTIEQLEIAAKGFEKEAGDLGSEFIGKQSGSEEAFQRFERSIEKARERLKQDLGIQSYEGTTAHFFEHIPLIANILLGAESTKPSPIQNSPPRENSCPSLPLIKTVHWPTPSSLENLFESSPSPSPPPSRKRAFIRAPLKLLSKNVKLGSSLSVTSDEVAECDDLLSDWNKELLLNRSERSNLSSSLAI